MSTVKVWVKGRRHPYIFESKELKPDVSDHIRSCMKRDKFLWLENTLSETIIPVKAITSIEIF